MNSRLTRVLPVLALLAPAVPAQAADPLIFQANWLIQGENAYMVAGKEKGFYKAEGIDLEIKRGFGSGDTLKKIVTGVGTIGAADMGVIMMAVVRENVPVKCISAEYAYHPTGFWTLDASGIKKVKDLEGKRIGITPGNSLLVYWPLLAKANNVDVSKVTWVNMEASALLPTLLAGQIDAMPGFTTNFDLRNDDAKAQGKPMHAIPMAQNGVRVYGECQFVHTATIKDKPDLLKRYVRATHKSLQWAKDNPEETSKIISAAYPELKQPAVLVNHNAFMPFVFNETTAKHGLGAFDLAQLQSTFDAVKTAQNITANPDVKSFIDTSFLPAAGH